MPHFPKRPALRIPQTLACTTLGCAIAATLACSGHVEDRTTDAGPGDASADVVAHDAPLECDGPTITCGTGPCPAQGATYCGLQCPPGCEPFV